jgi:hypothetical protein
VAHSTVLERYVPTRAIQAAVKGRETQVVEALKIPWQDGAPHISCPYPDHSDENPSWRWDERKARAFCTCIEQRGGHPILDVVMQVEGIEFEAAKLRVTEILGRRDPIRMRGEHHQAMDAQSLLRPSADQRDDLLPRRYLGHRLNLAPERVPLPSTRAAAWRELPYYDRPAKKGEKPKLVGRHPCVVFETRAPDGRQHAHRIYTAAEGAGKAQLGVATDGRPRDPKKSARLKDGQSAAGCAVLWGDPATALHLLLAEGIETSAVVALAHQAEIEAGGLAIAAALSTSGIRAFLPWPATRKITVAADRDEVGPPDDRGFKAGEKAARSFARAHHERVEIRIALPGDPGEDVDWLDVLRRAGVEAVRAAIGAASRFESPATNPASRDGEADLEASKDDDGAALREIVDRASADPSAPFECEALSALAAVRKNDRPGISVPSDS